MNNGRTFRGMAAPLVLLLAACSAEPDGAAAGNDAKVEAGTAPPPASSATPANAAAPAAGASLVIDGQGLALIGGEPASARPLRFGTPREQVLAALAFRGAPSESGRLEECGAGPLDYASWADGLTLHFQDGGFAGWAVRGRGAQAASSNGIRIGSSRAELERAGGANIFESSLGTEFEGGGLAGVLDGSGKSARITHLWAGASCVMR